MTRSLYFLINAHSKIIVVANLLIPESQNGVASFPGSFVEGSLTRCAERYLFCSRQRGKEDPNNKRYIHHN